MIMKIRKKKKRQTKDKENTAIDRAFFFLHNEKRNMIKRQKDNE